MLKTKHLVSSLWQKQDVIRESGPFLGVLSLS